MFDNIDYFFENFEKSAFRLETLPVYSVEDEAANFQAFLAGQDVPARTPENNEWLQLVQQATSAGKEIQRVHIVELPLSDYLQFEFGSYMDNLAAGELVRVADKDAAPELSELDKDFWLFDDEHVFEMNYDEQGRYLGVTKAQEKLGTYQQWKHIALAHSISFQEFNTHPGPASI